MRGNHIYAQANLPYDITTNRRLQQWRNERANHQGPRQQGQQQGNDQGERHGDRQVVAPGGETDDRQMVNLQAIRVQAPLNPNINDVKIAELWEGLTVNADIDLALNMYQPLLPMGEHGVDRSPTVYSSASDTSLIGVQGMGGSAWRMYLPEDNDNNYLEELMRDNMNVDIATLTPQETGLMVMEETRATQEGREQQGPLMIEGTIGGGHHGDRNLMGVSGEEVARSEYKALALAALQIGSNMGEGQVEEERPLSSMGARQKGGKQGERLGQGEILSEIDRVLMRVEEAMNELEEGGGSKRVPLDLGLPLTFANEWIK